LRADITSEALNEASCPDGTSASPYYRDLASLLSATEADGCGLRTRSAEDSDPPECEDIWLNVCTVVETVRTGTDNLDIMFTVL